MHARTYLSLSLLLLVSSLVGGYTENGHSFSSGGTSVSGGGTAFASGSGGTRASVRTRTSVRSPGRSHTSTTGSTITGSGDTASTEPTGTRRGGSRGRRSGETTERVSLGDGMSMSISSASGTGTVRASSSSSSSSTHSTGMASTSVGGTPRGTGSGHTSYEYYPTCRGIAKIRCCNDRRFTKINGKFYCDCMGSKPDADFCSFLQLQNEPLVVQDNFGAAMGEICVCQ